MRLVISGLAFGLRREQLAAHLGGRGLGFEKARDQVRRPASVQVWAISTASATVSVAVARTVEDDCQQDQQRGRSGAAGSVRFIHGKMTPSGGCEEPAWLAGAT